MPKALSPVPSLRRQCRPEGRDSRRLRGKPAVQLESRLGRRGARCPAYEGGARGETAVVCGESQPSNAEGAEPGGGGARGEGLPNLRYHNEVRRKDRI